MEGDILAGGVCGLYVNGVPHPTALDHKWRITKVSQAEAGYDDKGDTHCVNCEYMHTPSNPTSPCVKVEGLVEQRGCCNEHEHR